MSRAIWSVEFAIDPRGQVPVFEFIRDQGDAKIQALIVRKIEHVAKIRFHDMRRPLVDTLDGPVKELIVDKQVRVLFSPERDRDLLLMLEAERKKNGDVDEEVIRRARENRERWLKGASTASLDRIKEVLRLK